MRRPNRAKDRIVWEQISKSHSPSLKYCKFRLCLPIHPEQVTGVLGFGPSACPIIDSRSSLSLCTPVGVAIHLGEI